MAFRMNISRSGTIIAVSTRLWPDADFSFLTLPIRRHIRFSNLQFQIPESCRYPKSHSAHHTKSSPNERDLQGERNTAKPQSPSHFRFSQTSLPNRREHQPHSQNPWGVKYPRDRWCKERKEKAPILSLPLAENIKRLLRSIAPDG